MNAALKKVADKLLDDVESILGPKEDPDRKRVEAKVEDVIGWIRSEAKKKRGEERKELIDSAADLDELWEHVLSVIDDGLDDEECDEDP